MARMEGGCQIPLGCYGEEENGTLRLAGFIAMTDGKKEIRHEVVGPVKDREALAAELADTILTRGGREILASLR